MQDLWQQTRPNTRFKHDNDRASPTTHERKSSLPNIDTGTKKYGVGHKKTISQPPTTSSWHSHSLVFTNGSYRDQIHRAIQVAHSIEGNLTHTKYNTNQLCLLLNTIDSFLFGLNRCNPISVSVNNAIVLYTDVLNDLKAFSDKHKDYDLCSHLWRFEESALEIQNYCYRFFNSCSKIKIESINLSLSQLKTDMEEAKHRDKCNTDRILESISDVQSLERHFRWKESTTVEIMEKLQHLMLQADATTRKGISTVMRYMQVLVPSASSTLSTLDLTVLFDHPPVLSSQSILSTDRTLGNVREDRLKGREVSVAIKTFNSWLAREDFQTLVVSWTHLHHPNVVELFGIITTPNFRSAIMPYYADLDVLSYLKNRACADLKTIICEIGDGLSYLHAKSVVHGDLRAVNILIDEDGSPKLCNFGLVSLRCMMAEVDSSIQLADKYAWHSLQRLQTGKISLEDDVYALGVTIYEIGTSQIPFENIGKSDLIERLKHHDTLSIPKDSPIPRTLWEYVRSCWYDPSFRPTASKVAGQFRSASIDEANTTVEPYTFKSTSPQSGEFDKMASFSTYGRSSKPSDRPSYNQKPTSASKIRSFIAEKKDSTTYDKKGKTASRVINFI